MTNTNSADVDVTDDVNSHKNKAATALKPEESNSEKHDITQKTLSSLPKQTDGNSM